MTRPRVLEKAPKPVEHNRTNNPAGRPRGIPDKRTIAREELVAEATRNALAEYGPNAVESMSALQVLEFGMRTALRANLLFKACELAAMIAPYRHAKMQPLTYVDGDEYQGMSDEDLHEELNRVRGLREAANTVADDARRRALVAKHQIADVDPDPDTPVN